jgi:hypothetical protein
VTTKVLVDRTHKRYLIYGIDPGDTTGLAILHIYTPPTKFPSPIIRMWTTAISINDVKRGRRSDWDTSRDPDGWNDQYWQYRAVTRLLGRFISDARTSAHRYYPIEPENCYIGVEKYEIPAQHNDTSLGALSPVYISTMLEMFYQAQADVYEERCGRSHVSRFVYIRPQDRNQFQGMKAGKIANHTRYNACKAAGLIIPRDAGHHQTDAVAVACCVATRLGIEGLRLPIPKDERSADVFAGMRVYNPADNLDPDGRVVPIDMGLDVDQPFLWRNRRHRIMGRVGQTAIEARMKKQKVNDPRDLAEETTEGESNF